MTIWESLHLRMTLQNLQCMISTVKKLKQLNPAYKTYTTTKYTKSCLTKHQIHDLAKVIIIIINDSPGTCHSDCCTIFHLALPDRQNITISLRLLAS